MLSIFQRALHSAAIEVISLLEIGLPEPPSSGRNDIEIATGKAAVIAALAHMPAVGLSGAFEIEALGRGRGGLKRRFPDPWRDSRESLGDALKRAYDDLAQGGYLSHNDRLASFRCLICLAWPDMETELFEGVEDGRIADAVESAPTTFADCFVPEGESVTLAALDGERRRAYSHYERAIDQLRRSLLG